MIYTHDIKKRFLYAFVFAGITTATSIFSYCFRFDHEIYSRHQFELPIEIVGVMVFLIALGFAYLCLYIWSKNNLIAHGKHAKHNENIIVSNKLCGKVSFKLVFVLTLIIALSWMIIWEIPHYPGTIRDDTIYQFLQYFRYIDYYTQHPIFSTLIFGMFWKIGSIFGAYHYGLFLFVILNSIFEAFIISLILSYAYKKNMPASLLIVLVVIISISRVFYMPVNAMSKDALNTPFFVLSMFFIVRMIETNGLILSKTKNFIVISLVIFVTVATKRSMLIILACVFLCFILYLLFNRKYKNVLRTISVQIIPFALSIILFSVAPMLIGIHQTRNSEMYSIPLQQIAFTLNKSQGFNNQNINKEEFEQVFISSNSYKNYNPTRSDEMIKQLKPNYETKNLLTLWYKLGVSNLSTYAESMFLLNNTWFAIDETIDYGNNSQIELINRDRVHSIASGISVTGEELEAILHDVYLGHDNTSYMVDNALIYDKWQFESIPWLSSFGFWCWWIPLLFFLYIIYSKNWSLCVLASGIVALLLSCLMGPIVLYWYSMPFVFISPLVLSSPYILKKTNSARISAIE